MAGNTSWSINVLPAATYETGALYLGYGSGIEAEFSKNRTWSQPERGPGRDTSPLPHYALFYKTGNKVGKDLGHIAL